MTVPKPYTVEQRRDPATGVAAYRMLTPEGATPWRSGGDELRMKLAMTVDGLNEAFALGAAWHARQTGAAT